MGWGADCLKGIRGWPEQAQYGRSLCYSPVTYKAPAQLMRGEGLGQWGTVSSAVEGSTRWKAHKNQCRCIIMMHTRCVQSAAVSLDRLLSPVRIRSGPWRQGTQQCTSMWTWASSPLCLDALKLLLGTTGKPKSPTWKPRLLQNKVKKETRIRILHLTERRHWIQAQEYIKEND